MRYYHSTDYESSLSIIENGFNAPDTIWCCSNPSNTYMIQDSDYNLQISIENGLIAAAHKNSKSDKISIFAFEIPDDLLEDGLLENDDSCEYAPDCFQIDSDELNALIQNGTVECEMHIIENLYNPNLRPFYLIGLSNEYAPSDGKLYEAIELLAKTDIIPYDFLYENVPSELSATTFSSIITLKGA